MSRLEHFRFSGAGMDPEAAFARYRELYARGSDVTRTSEPLHLEVRAWRLGSLILFDRHLSGVVHARADRVADDGFDHFFLNHILSGRARGVGAAPFELQAGQTVLFDATRPMRIEYSNARIVTMSVSRAAVEAAVGSADRLHGRLLQPPDNVLLADFLERLVERADILAPHTMPAVGRAIIELLASALAENVRAGAEARRLQFARREAAIRHIAAHLGDASLSAETIASTIGVSRSALYRLFERDGGVGPFVQKMRLDALRAALERMTSAPLAELAQRFGFSGESHMSRLFSRTYGCAPGAYRKAAFANVDPNDPTPSKRRWDAWMVELK